MITNEALQSLIPTDDPIIGAYLDGSQHPGDLAINSANRVEKVLASRFTESGVDLPAGYSVGDNPRQFSRRRIDDLACEYQRWLRLPQEFQREIVNLDPPIEGGLTLPDRVREEFFEFLGYAPSGGPRKRITHEDIRAYLRFKIADIVGSEIPEVGDGCLRRLLDHPAVCDRLIEIYNQHSIKRFEAYMRGRKFFRLGKHTREETINESQHSRPSTINSYVARTFCPKGTRAVLKKKSRTPTAIRDEVLEERDDILMHLPIDPDMISVETLVKMGLGPQEGDFKSYTPQARRRYTMMMIPEFRRLLTTAKPTARPYAGNVRGEPITTGRVISFLSAQGEERIGVFSTTSDLSTEVIASGSKPRNRHHEMRRTELRIFTNRQDAVDGQQHAIDSMSQRLSDYSEVFNNLQYHMGYCREYLGTPAERRLYLRGVTSKLGDVFIGKPQYEDRLVYRYLFGSDEGVPTKSLPEHPFIIAHLRKRLGKAIHKLRDKIEELSLLIPEING